MKQLFIVISFFFLSMIHAKAAKVPGMIINHKDTQRVTFLSSNIYDAMQFSIPYMNALNEKKTVYPTEATEIIIQFKSGTAKYLSRVNTIGAMYRDKIPPTDKIFLLLVSDGKLKHFIYSDEYCKDTCPFNVLQKEGGSLLLVPLLISFHQTMMDYFSDCPALYSKLQKREFHSYNVNDIVQYYNDNCDTKISPSPNPTINSIQDLNININVDSIINK